MNDDYERAYFEAAIARNQLHADQATDPSIRDIHLQLIRLYEFAMEEPIDVL